MAEDYSSLSDERLREKIAELEAKLETRKPDERTHYRRDIAELEEVLEARRQSA